MPRHFITETLQESIPVIFFGEKSVFVETLVRHVGIQNPEYEGRFAHEFSRFPPKGTPYAVVFSADRWGKGTAETLALAIQKGKEWGSPCFLLISDDVFEFGREEIKKAAKQSLVMIVDVFEVSPENIRTVLDQILNGRKKRGEVRITTKSGQEARDKAVRNEVAQKTYSLFSHLPTEFEVRGTVRQQVPQVKIKTMPQVWPQSESDHEEHEKERVLFALFQKNRQAPTSSAQSTPPQSSSPQRHSDQSHSAKPLFRYLNKEVKIILFSLAVVGIFLLSTTLFFEYIKKGVQASLRGTQASLFSDALTQGSIKKEMSALQRRAVVFQIVRPVVAPLYSLFGKEDAVEDTEQLIQILEKGGAAMQSSAQLSQSLANIFIQVVSSGNEQPFAHVNQVQSDTEYVEKQLAQFSAELARAKQNTLFDDNKTYQALQKKLMELRKDTISIDHALPAVAQMLGTQQKKTYLILIQNSLELRPTGGFIGSFALVTFDKGKLLDVQVQDSYAADNLLNGKVEPPADLQTYLSEKQWYFRDSNWSPDFPKTARQSLWFIEKELGVKIDGVIGINANTLQEILRAIGPVRVADYDNESVSAENIFERLQNRSELSLSLTGTKKREYLTALSSTIFSAIQAVRDVEPAEKLGSALLKTLETSDTLLAVNDSDIQQTFALLGWSGAVATPSCPPQFAQYPCFVDTVFHVDTNVGVNRANFYVKRSMNHSVILTENAAIHTHTMRFTNGAPSSAWPAGPYRDYIRLYVPDFTQLTNIVIDQKPLSASAITQDSEFGKRVIGFPLDIPVGKTTTVTVSYTTQLTTSKITSYALFLQRQPGSDAYPTSLSVQVQKPLQAVVVAPEGAVVGNIIQFDTAMDTHQYMAVEVARE